MAKDINVRRETISPTLKSGVDEGDKTDKTRPPRTNPDTAARDSKAQELTPARPEFAAGGWLAIAKRGSLWPLERPLILSPRKDERHRRRAVGQNGGFLRFGSLNCSASYCGSMISPAMWKCPLTPGAPVSGWPPPIVIV